MTISRHETSQVYLTGELVVSCNTYNCNEQTVAPGYLSSELMRDAIATFGWFSVGDKDYDLCRDCYVIHGNPYAAKPLGILNAHNGTLLEKAKAVTNWKRWKVRR